MADRTVTVYVSPPNNLYVDQNTLDCGKWPRRDMDIKWQIDTTGWKFTEDGIVFKDNDDGTFHDPQPGKHEFHWSNSNQKERLYHYTVNVISTDGNNTRLSLDPGIQNHGNSMG
jgi:hypothetical protein